MSQHSSSQSVSGSKNHPVFVLSLLVLLLILFTVGLGSVSAALPLNSPLPLKQNNQTTAPTGPVKINGENFIDSSGARLFLSGVNYEGHTDRAWLMWNDDKFDPSLINRDLSLASNAGYNSIRVFIQLSILDDVMNSRWTKLDKFLEIAEKNNIKVLITLADYPELDLSKLNQVDNLIARHLAGSTTVLGYDLKNEPQFYDLAGAVYPAGKKPALLSDNIIGLYGERISQAATNNWRETADGQLVVPAWMDAKTAYYYANSYRVYLNFLDEGSKWVVSHNAGSSFIDWLKSPDSIYWKGFVDAFSSTLETWINVRQSVIRTADPASLVTIGFNHTQFAYLKANDILSFVSLHRFDKEGANGILTTLHTLDQLRVEHPGKPVVLEEFGYSNSHGTDKTVSQNLTASYEAAVWLFLYSRGYAGGFKWMLTNFPNGSTPEENNFGLLDDQTQPKANYYTSKAIHNYIASNRNPVGDFVLLESRDGTAISYMWAGPDTIFSNIKDFTDNRIDIHQQDYAGWQTWWPTNNQSQVYFSSASKGRVTYDLGKFFPKWNPKLAPSLVLDNGQQPGMDRKDGLVSFPVEPGISYTLNVPLTPSAFQPTRQTNTPNSVFFKETGHNLAGLFKSYWESHGGLWLYGFPISEEFQEGGYTVQYFERNRFEFHPEALNSPYEVQLGLLGLNLTAGRKESGSKAFQPLPTTTASGERDFYKETSHSLGGIFKAYWLKYGGLAQFGFPLSEEFTELNPADGKTYNVQYFERARFEYHPEAKGTPNEVLLGLLGNQIVKSKGWLN